MKKENLKERKNIFLIIWQAICNAFYSLKVAIYHVFHKNTNNKDTQKGMSNRKRNNIIFYIVLMAWPVVQFCIFYLGVNVNSIIMAFQKYDATTYKLTGFTLDNLTNVFNKILHEENIMMFLRNSLLYFGIGLGCTMLGLFFSYYVYKKMPGHKFFRVLLFVPSIISPIVIGLIYMNFINSVIPGYARMWSGGKTIISLVDTDAKKRAVVIAYNVLLSFGVNVLMYTSSMSSIDDSVIESAQLDGANSVREFFSIVLPLIYPTIATFLTVSVAGIFTNQYNLFALYGDNPPIKIQTLGYYVYLQTYFAVAGAKPDFAYIEPATWGVVLTLVAAPITLFIKWLLKVLGPSAE